MKEIKLLEAIRKRRSVRRFQQDKALSSEQVGILMEAGLRAPSSRNGHTTQFVLVEDKEQLKALSHLRESGGTFLRDVPLAVVVLGSPMECKFWQTDASLSAGYLQLQATEMGLASCWVQVADCFTANGQDSAEYVRNLLDIPYQLEVLCVIALGYPEGESPERSLEELRWEQIHIGKYQIAETQEESNA